MTRVWHKVNNDKAHATNDGEFYVCGIGRVMPKETALPKKPRINVCKNCMRVINKKK